MIDSSAVEAGIDFRACYKTFPVIPRGYSWYFQYATNLGINRGRGGWEGVKIGEKEKLYLTFWLVAGGGSAGWEFYFLPECAVVERDYPYASVSGHCSNDYDVRIYASTNDK